MADSSTFSNSAYGGKGWSQRTDRHADEMSTIWRGGVDSEWRELRSVLLRRPGGEVAVEDADAAQQLEVLDHGRAQTEHDQLAEAYRQAGVDVIETPDTQVPTPNRMFCAVVPRFLRRAEALRTGFALTRLGISLADSVAPGVNPMSTVGLAT